MNKKQALVTTIVAVLATTYIAVDNQKIFDNNQVKTTKSSADDYDQKKIVKQPYNTEAPSTGSEKIMSHEDKGFDFTPYISNGMAEEIRPYTSRDTTDLDVEVDNDGNEYVDLKKRWSHATVSVIDENGVKHTGEWAPKK